MIPEQGALLRKARDSLRGATLLAGDGLYDFAASRAYYAMMSACEVIFALLDKDRLADIQEVSTPQPSNLVL